jgi:D-alanyl-D-alanine carboxypeptidase (penicillin-binding protein 5/6)
MNTYKQQAASSEHYIGEGCKISLFLFLLAAYCIFPTVSYSDEFRSRAVVVMDASTGGVLYAKNPDLKCPPASTTKLMTAIVAIENANLADIVTISNKAAHVSPHKAGFKRGDKVTVEKLLYAALLGSANDAAVALSEAVAGSEARFVELMNRKAVEIGARDTKFINSNGLPGPGQYITAYDLSKIMSYALRYPILKQIIGTRVTGVSTENGNAIFLKNTNRLLWSDEDLVGGKTGYTRKARHCFVCAAERNKGTVIIALLGSPSRENLWKETEELIGKGFEVIASKEEPIIYFTKVDYDSINLKKASYKKNSRLKIKNSKLIKAKTKFAKKRGKIKTLASGKGKKGKNYRIAEKIEDRNKG